jgi:hypothetical protein
MASLRSYRILSLDGALNTSTFTPVVSDGNWNNLVVSNKNGAVALTICTDPDDSATEFNVDAGSEFNVAVVLTQQLQRVYSSRFKDGEICAYIKVASGDGAGVAIIWA